MALYRCPREAPLTARAAAPSEDDRLPTIANDAVLRVPQHGTRQHLAFHIRTASSQLSNGVSVGDADRVLVNDRPLILVFGDVVRGRSDQFHAALLRLQIWVGPNECRKE